jgi:integrase
MGVSPFKDGKGRTRYRVTFSRNGRRLVDERLPAGTTKDKAEAYHARIVGEWFDRDRLGVQEIPMIAEVIREYQQRVMPKLRSRFAESNIRAVARHVIGKRMDQLPQAADAVRKALATKAPATIHYRLMFLKTLAKQAVRWKLCERDYGSSIEVPKIDNARQFYISKAELAKILRFADRETRRGCWQLFYTGMRRGELYAATITKDAYIIARAKNGDPRIVPIPEALRRIVGRPKWHPDVLTDRFKKAAIKAGYGHLRLHDLRHSAASQVLNAGADLGTVGMILGHRSPKSTWRYAHLATEKAREWLNFAARGRQVSDFSGRQGLGRSNERKKKVA